MAKLIIGAIVLAVILFMSASDYDAMKKTDEINKVIIDNQKSDLPGWPDSL